MSPSFTLSNLRTEYLGGQRGLLNAGISLGGYYQFRKNSLSASVRAQFNEDEYTAENPDLRYSGNLMYIRKASSRFSWHIGVAYTFLLGNVDGTGYFLPVAGARIRIGEYSKLIISLPYAIRYSRYISPKTFFSAHLQAQGGINRFRNNYNYPGAPHEVLLLRRRSVLLGAGVFVPASNNVIVGAELAGVFAQKFSITNQDQESLTVYEQGRVHNGYQVSARFIWRPWQNKLRNKPSPANTSTASPEISDDDFLLGF